MKRYFLTIIIIAGLIVGCDDELSQQSNSDNNKISFTNSVLHDTLRSQINKIGTDHNTIMDIVYDQLQKMKDTILPDVTITDSTQASELILDLLEYGLDSLGYNLSSDLDPLKDIFRTSIEESADSSTMSLEAKLILYDLESRLEDYYDGLLSLNNFNLYCENQLDSALNLNSETDAKIVGCGLSVAKNSVNYWENNLDKWNDLFDEFEDTPLSTTNDKLASDDTAGAVGGAIWGTTLGSGFGTIVGGLAGAIVGSMTGATLDTAEVGDPARSAVVALVTGLLFLI